MCLECVVYVKKNWLRHKIRYWACLAPLHTVENLILGWGCCDEDSTIRRNVLWLMFTDVVVCGEAEELPSGSAWQWMDGHRCDLYHIWKAPRISRRKVKTPHCTHPHAHAHSRRDNHIHHKCLQRRSTCQSGTRTASKYSRTLFWSWRRGGAYPLSCKTDTVLLCNSDSVWKITQHFKSDKIPGLPWSIDVSNSKKKNIWHLFLNHLISYFSSASYRLK